MDELEELKIFVLNSKDRTGNIGHSFALRHFLYLIRKITIWEIQLIQTVNIRQAIKQNFFFNTLRLIIIGCSERNFQYKFPNSTQYRSKYRTMLRASYVPSMWSKD